jgi:CubicO group peptidase (beta-lactamase class C family)
MRKAFKRSFFGVILLFIIFVSCNSKHADNSLPRSTPETEGVSSQSIITFLDSAAKSRHEFHSIMILRHGKVIAEGWWNPYRPDLKHTLYSTSKSFTSTAIGFAVSEKKMSVNDKVVSFFPEYLPDTVSQYLSELKVKDLLTMSVGHDPDPTFSVISRDSNWVKSFLALPIINKPGSKFLYNTLATYTLSAIVQKVTGEKVIDYLTPRLFKPLGIEGIDWETDPRGINTGGWGLRLKTEDMAKFGQLLLQKGNWNGKQIIEKEWVEEATTLKIFQAPDLPQSTKDSSDWMQGYCYQFWRCRNNAFRADGAYGQYIIVMPEKDAVIAITSEAYDMQNELNLVWKYLLPAFSEDKLPLDEKSSGQLKQKLSALALPLSAKTNQSSIATEISGKTFSFARNERDIQSVSLQFKDDLCLLNLKTSSGSYDISFASGRWLSGETIMRGPSLLVGAKGSYVGLPPFKIAGAYTWKDDLSLELKLRFIESPHSETITCHFDNNKISIDITDSNNPGRKSSSLEGLVQQ